jgi:glycosyltransferase involved in cell wall biosynthesis
VRRILFAQKFPSLGGAQVSLVQHLAHLDRARYEPHVAVSGEGWLTAELDRLGVPWILLPFGHWNAFAVWRNAPLVARLASYIAQHRIDLVHANEHWVGPPCLAAARRAGVPAVCHFRTGLEDLTAHRVRKYRYDGFDRVIVVADVLRRALAPRLRDPGRVVVVRDGVDGPKAAPAGTRRERRSSRRVLINVGALYAVKGQAKILDQALPWLTASSRRYLVFVGGSRQDSDYAAGMQRLVAARGLQRQVRFLGVRDDVPRLLGMADTLVAYSTVEGIPRAVMEAMLAGLPVIVGNSAGMEEAVSDGDTGRIVDFEAPGGAFAQALEDFAARPAAWREMGRRGAGEAARRFSTAAMSQAIQSVYNDLLHGDP